MSFGWRGQCCPCPGFEGWTLELESSSVMQIRKTISQEAAWICSRSRHVWPLPGPTETLCTERAAADILFHKGTRGCCEADRWNDAILAALCYASFAVARDVRSSLLVQVRVGSCRCVYHLSSEHFAWSLELARWLSSTSQPHDAVKFPASAYLVACPRCIRR